jgi:pyruvate/2-oxoglutarate/acetoin dehydrogenase E1 component
VTRQISFAVALNEALKEEMRRDAAVFVVGEDVGKMGGLFKVTQDLLEEFGPERVLDTPISEAAIAGLGSGRGGSRRTPSDRISIYRLYYHCHGSDRQPCR